MAGLIVGRDRKRYCHFIASIFPPKATNFFPLVIAIWCGLRAFDSLIFPALHLRDQKPPRNCGNIPKKEDVPKMNGAPELRVFVPVSMETSICRK